jgi:hypothetical protein
VRAVSHTHDLLLQKFGCAKVGKLANTIGVYEHVGALDVAMHNVPLVEERQPGKHHSDI